MSSSRWVSYPSWRPACRCLASKGSSPLCTLLYAELSYREIRDVVFSGEGIIQEAALQGHSSGYPS